MVKPQKPAPDLLVCPICQGPLAASAAGVECESCGRVFVRNSAGYLQFPVEAGGAEEQSERLENYLGEQATAAEGLFSRFIGPYVEKLGARRILDAGCGSGALAARIAQAGPDTYGVDLPKASAFWKESNRDADRFFVADAAQLPFAEGAFDLVLSLGVIEHIGTVTGHSSLAPNFRARRASYARELVRVVRPGGAILVVCPNKSFPIDLHHGPGDATALAGAPASDRARGAIHRATRLNVHKTWGRYHLVSYGELEQLFRAAGAGQVRAVPSRGYFAYESLPGGPVRSAVRAYVEGLPKSLRGTFLNPFVLAEIRR